MLENGLQQIQWLYSSYPKDFMTSGALILCHVLDVIISMVTLHPQNQGMETGDSVSEKFQDCRAS